MLVPGLLQCLPGTLLSYHPLSVESCLIPVIVHMCLVSYGVFLPLMLMAIVPCEDGVSHSFWIAHLEVLKNKTKQPTLISTSFAVCSYSEKNQKPNNKKKNRM